MDNKILSKEYGCLKNSKTINDDYIKQRDIKYQEVKNKNNKDNSTVKEYKCIYCNSNKVAISNSRYMGSRMDLEAKMVKFYCNTCNCHFYLRWEDLL